MTATPATANVVVTGNSIPAGASASGPTMYFPAQLSRAFPLGRTGITAQNKAVGAQSWDTLRTDYITPIHNAWQSGKRNVLVAWESSNQFVLNPGSTVADCSAAMLSFFSALLAVHPWSEIVLMTTIPRYNGSQANTIALNDLLRGWNAEARVKRKNWEAQLGVPIYLCDIGATAPFNFSPTVLADFPPDIYSDGTHLVDNGAGVAARITGLTLATIPA